MRKDLLDLFVIMLICTSISLIVLALSAAGVGGNTMTAHITLELTCNREDCDTTATMTVPWPPRGLPDERLYPEGWGRLAPINVRYGLSRFICPACYAEILTTFERNPNP